MFTRDVLKKIATNLIVGVAALAACYMGTFLTLRVFNTTSVDQVWPPLLLGFMVFLDLVLPTIILLAGEAVKRRHAREEVLESLKSVSLDEAIHRASWKAAGEMMDEMDDSYSPPVRKWLYPMYEFSAGIGIGAAFRIGNALYVALWALFLFFFCEMIKESMGKPDTKTTAFEIQYRIFENGQRIAAGCVVCLFCIESWIVGAIVASLTIPLMHTGEKVGKELHWILNRKKSTT